MATDAELNRIETKALALRTRDCDGCGELAAIVLDMVGWLIAADVELAELREENGRLRGQLTCSLCGTSLDGKRRFACEPCIAEKIAELDKEDT